jgi:threonine/homoserine/homoserine lactone efflux protein
LMLLPGLAVTAFGLTSLLSALGEGFEPIRWVGVVYLVYLGVMPWHAPPPNRRQGLPSPWLPRAVYGRGFAGVSGPSRRVALPRFATSTSHFAAQMLPLSVTLSASPVIADIGWAVLAGWARRFLPNFRRVLDHRRDRPRRRPQPMIGLIPSAASGGRHKSRPSVLLAAGGRF